MRVLHVGWGFTPLRPGGLIEYTEDLMEIQAARDYGVAYFFAGRFYPILKSPRLRKWWRGGVRMYEVINSPVGHGFENGTVRPEVELSESWSEKFFAETLTEFRPDILHIQELAGLPSSLIDLAAARDIPVLMTLHDYFTLCPTMKLFDRERAFCAETNVGDKCARCCSGANQGTSYLMKTTLRYEARRRVSERTYERVKKAGRLPKRVAGAFINRSIEQIEQNAKAGTQANDELAGAFQRRRSVNVERLNKVDLLVAQSNRVAEIYRALGIQPERLITLHSTLKHIARLRPKSIAAPPDAITFATLNGCSSVQKGAHLILGALRILRDMKLARPFRLMAFGGMVGDADARDELLGFDNFIHKGPYKVEELGRLLEEVHVGIVPSIWEEVYGYVGVEMIAQGIPVIGNAAGGIVDYTVEGLTGWVNKANTPEGLAQIMAGIIEDPGQIVCLNDSIAANRDRLIKTMESHFEEVDDLYRDVIASKRRSVSAAAPASSHRVA